MLSINTKQLQINYPKLGNDRQTIYKLKNPIGAHLEHTLKIRPIKIHFLLKLELKIVYWSVGHPQ